MNVISELFNGLSDTEKAALQATVDDLAPKWDAADASGKAAIELQFTEALNSFRASEI